MRAKFGAAECDKLRLFYRDTIHRAALDGVHNAALWRQLLDPWYAYYRGPEFVKGTGNPITFNPSEMQQYRTTIAQLPFTRSAQARWSAGFATGLKREHSVPIAYLRNSIIANVTSGATISEVERFLIENFCIAIVTTDENRLLTEYHCDMPEGWRAVHGLFERYRLAGIQMA